MSKIRETLQKAYDDAHRRATGIGMVNTYGKSPSELHELRKASDEAWEEVRKAAAALDAFDAP
jgi:hypothetical protein